VRDSKSPQSARRTSLGSVYCSTFRAGVRRSRSAEAHLSARHCTLVLDWRDQWPGRAGPDTRPSAAAAYTERHRATEQYNGLTPPPGLYTPEMLGFEKYLFDLIQFSRTMLR